MVSHTAKMNCTRNGHDMKTNHWLSEQNRAEVCVEMPQQNIKSFIMTNEFH